KHFLLSDLLGKSNKKENKISFSVFLCTPNCTQKTAYSSDREIRSQLKAKAVTKKELYGRSFDLLKKMTNCKDVT
ncbi:hypothetical protein KSU48_18265, partial [Erysipelatoclostridium sp. MSK.23.67]|uniref:hypothetical protein n=1 Tax=Thomasclavelia TaxID=3025755 RepID=UPI001C394912